MRLRYLHSFLMLLGLMVVFSAWKAVDQQRQIIVVIDPGHGGGDPGNLHVQEGMQNEKHLNLLISKKIGDYIERYTSNVKVIYTRTKDETVTLNQRVHIANSNNADYFLSIHCNATGNKHICGTETHIHNNNTRTSRLLATMIEKDFKTRSKRNSRGVKTKDDRSHNLQVLWQTKMPGVLVECGFMSNKQEEDFLNSSHGQDLIASSIFRAFRDFVNKQHPHTTLTTQETPAPTEENPAPPVASGVSIYKVQVIATKTPLPEDAIERKRLEGYTLEEIEATDGRTFKYRYFVGRETDKKEARKLVKEIRDKGISDAFLVEFEQ